MARKKKDPSPSNDVPATKDQPVEDAEPITVAEESTEPPIADEATDHEALIEDEPALADEAPAAEAPEGEAPEAELSEDPELAEDEPAEEASDDEPEPVDIADEMTEEPAEDEMTAAAANLPTSPSTAEPATSSYPPPPPYDPNVIPITKATPPPGFVSPVGADYMLASALGTPKKKFNRTPVLIAAGVLVVALVGGIIWVAPTLIPGLFGPARYATPKAAVETYLNALAQGDSATALKVAVTTPTETALLTDDLLKSSQQRAPITGIVVKDVAGSSSATVAASYQIGGRTVTANFATQKVGNEWRLVTITRDVQLTGVDKVATTLNGVTINDHAHLTLFPGSYVLASANDRLAIHGGEFVVQSPSDFANPNMGVEISKKGITDARAAAQAKLNGCLKSTELLPADCGFGAKAGDVKAKTVKWEVTSGAGALKNADFRAGTSEPYISTVYPYVQLKVSVLDNAGRRYTSSDTITTVKADLSGTDVVVTFNK